MTEAMHDDYCPAERRATALEALRLAYSDELPADVLADAVPQGVFVAFAVPDSNEPRGLFYPWDVLLPWHSRAVERMAVDPTVDVSTAMWDAFFAGESATLAAQAPTAADERVVPF